MFHINKTDPLKFAFIYLVVEMVSTRAKYTSNAVRVKNGLLTHIHYSTLDNRIKPASHHQKRASSPYPLGEKV